jgi:anti-sigma B factor antagonist
MSSNGRSDKFDIREADMDISREAYKRVTVITVTGRVDSSTADQFEAAVNDELKSGQRNLIFDLNEVDFLSSAGLRILVMSRKEAQKGGGVVRLAQPSDRVKETLEIAGLDVLFESFPSREEAIAAY